MNRDTLNKILASHKLWLETDGKEGECADLRGADLYGANLRGVDLRGANLRYADLYGANLRGVDLRYANLRYADLRGADLYGADLRGADLCGADIDFSCFPLWCGSLNVHIDERQASQLLYHVLRNVKFSKNISDGYREAVMVGSVVAKANEFHRVGECGAISEGEANG